MLLSALVLAAALGPATQDAAPAATDLPAANTGASQAAIDAGIARFKKRRFSQAEVDFRRALDADPGSAAPYFYLGYTYYKLAEKKRPFHPDKQKAKDMFAKAYELDPAFRPVWGEPRK
jgi:tetratricopeptide (TPR) repeat protein